MTVSHLAKKRGEDRPSQERGVWAGKGGEREKTLFLRKGKKRKGPDKGKRACRVDTTKRKRRGGG